MNNIELDGSRWKTVQDFYDAILRALGAPDWHGTNANALVESIVWGGINRVQPPYRLLIKGTDHVPPDVAQEISWIEEDVRRARIEFRQRQSRDVDVSFNVVR